METHIILYFIFWLFVLNYEYQPLWINIIFCGITIDLVLSAHFNPYYNINPLVHLIRGFIVKMFIFCSVYSMNCLFRELVYNHAH